MDVATMISQAQQLAGRVDSDFDARTLRFLNEGLERWAHTKPWLGLRKVISVTANGERTLVFPEYVRTVQWIADQSNQTPMDYIDHWDRRAPTAYLGDSSGTPSWWREDGVQPVYRQPTALSYLAVNSTASDNFTIHVSGICQDTSQSGTAGEYYHCEEFMDVTGSTGTTSANLYKEIISFGKDRLTVSDAKLWAEGVQIARIHKNRFETPYRRIEMLRIPSSGTVLKCGTLLRPPALVHNDQVPHGSVNPNFLVWYAASLIHKAMNESQQASVCLAQAMDILDKKYMEERTFADRDWSSLPDPDYWGFEDYYSWPFSKT